MKKTAHQLARELLAGPDLPISHFDPSFADACDEENNYTHGEVIVEIEDPAEGLTAEELADLEARGVDLSRFITLSGDQDPERDRVDPTTLH